MLAVSAVRVLAHKHELVALQSAVVVANRGGVLSSVGGSYQYKLLCSNDLTGSAKRGTSLASTPTLATGGASPALRLPITAAAVG